MTSAEAIDFVRRHGVVLMSARGPVPSLAQEIAGEPIRGSWWAHPMSQSIFHLSGAVSDSKEILVCRLVEGKITFVHRRLWPALARIAHRFPRKRLAAVREEHTLSGAHKVTEVPFPRWMPAASVKESKRLGEEEAVAALGAELVERLTLRKGRGR